jgi:hypothetical protein
MFQVECPQNCPATPGGEALYPDNFFQKILGGRMVVDTVE